MIRLDLYVDRLRELSDEELLVRFEQELNGYFHNYQEYQRMKADAAKAEILRRMKHQEDTEHATPD